MHFALSHKDSITKARAGVLHTDHGSIQTPIFMPVGTVATVKAVHQEELKNVIRAQIILGNTYHLYLRPSTDILVKAGGLHKFNGWDRPILTDSGGFQVFSLAHRRKITEEGVTFASHIDGSKHLFSPERVVDIQRKMGADIIMAFDECTPYPCPYNYAERSMHLTHRWLKRCWIHFRNTDPIHGYEQALFPVVQGSTYKDLRRQSAETIASYDTVGNAIGGLAVGEPHEDMYEITDLVCSILPSEKPRYLMGVGTPINILECIALGVDMFDCVMPTRNARHGLLFTSKGTLNIKNAKWKDDFSPIDANAPNATSQTHTKAYLRHLFVAKEILGQQLASIHNLAFYLWLVGEARKHILAATFSTWKDQMIKDMNKRL